METDWTYHAERIEQIVQQAVCHAMRSVLNLDNGMELTPRLESEEQMPLNKNKIRRPIVLNGVRTWISGNSEQEYAENLLKAAGHTAPPPAGDKHSFRAYAENWFNVFSKPNVRYVTALTYERQLDNYIYPVLGDAFLEDITTADVQQVFNRMGQHAKQETKNKVKIVLNQIFQMAYEERLIARNPMHSATLRIKGEASAATLPYSVAQMQYLAAHLNDISDPYAKAWLALSISLPLRPEEVLGLTWADLDEAHQTVHIRNTVTHPTRNEPHFQTYTKTASSKRDLQLPAEILSYLPPRGKDTDFIVGGTDPISYTKLRGMRKWITKETGFDETISPRRFRTTVATDISAMTHDLKLVQKMLGHSNPQMTLKYYDKGRSQTADASEAIRQCYQFSEN